MRNSHHFEDKTNKTCSSIYICIYPYLHGYFCIEQKIREKNIYINIYRNHANCGDLVWNLVPGFQFYPLIIIYIYYIYRTHKLEVIYIDPLNKYLFTKSYIYGVYTHFLKTSFLSILTIYPTSAMDIAVCK